MSSHNLRSTFDGAGINGDAELLCKCGYPMKDYRVKDEKSAYRGNQYWSCRKHSRDDSRCKTWIWFHEVDQVKQLLPPAKIAPRTPQKQRDIRFYGDLSPPTSLKRKMAQVSFDSAVGDMSDDEPGPSSPSRSPKKPRNVDAATQTPKTKPHSPSTTDKASAIPRESPSPPTREQRNVNSIPRPSQTPDRSRFGLFAPSTKQSVPRQQGDCDRPTTPTKPVQIPQLNFSGLTTTRSYEDSDLESYGWDDELETDILHVAESFES